MTQTGSGVTGVLVSLGLIFGSLFGGCDSASYTSGGHGCHAPAENNYQCVAGSEW